MRVLVTGATGFAGQHLVEFLLKHPGVEVTGVGRDQCDLNDADRVQDVVEKARPDRVFHLAAQSSVPVSWERPIDTMRVNVMGQVHLLEAVRRTGLKPLILIACSSEEYGAVLPNQIPVKESQSLKPISPYGVSKVAQYLMAAQYFQTYKLPIIRTRAFSHTGRGQREEYVAGNFAKQIACIEAGEKEPVLRVGNLEPIRDFTDARDVVRAYWLALEKGVPGEVYNVCSGVGRKIDEIVRVLVGLSCVKIEVREEPGRMRPSDVPVMIGDNTLFRERTGWKPEIGLEKTLGDLLDFWREKIDAGKIQNKN